MKDEIKSFRRVGVEAPRAYYIPFGEGQEIPLREGIVDREKSERFVSLNGIWQIREHECPENVTIGEELTESIPVPSCVQMHGYDRIQYINCRYPFPFDPPYVPRKNPTYHYRREFAVETTDEKYYLVFEARFTLPSTERKSATGRFPTRRTNSILRRT